jgi:S-adenosylmethionine:tRNA-ribosyltransferase-isomerase (queuine synthetase)
METKKKQVLESKFFLRELNSEQRLWDVLVDPARKIRIGNKLYFGDDDSLVAEVIDNTTSRKNIAFSLRRFLRRI